MNSRYMHEHACMHELMHEILVLYILAEIEAVVQKIQAEAKLTACAHNSRLSGCDV